MWIPLGIVLAVVALVGLGIGLARLRHVHARNQIKARLEEFKEQVIQFRQRVEAVQERHRFLPYKGEDDKLPMAGTTRDVYAQLKTEIEKLSDDWLRRMDLWEKVEELIRAEKPLSAARFNEASRLLDTLGSFDEVDQNCTACVRQLDRLETGHEEARKQLVKAEERTTSLRQQIDAVRDLGLPTGPYEAALATCPPLIEQARQAVAADPLGASDTLTTVHSKMDDLEAWMKDVIRLHARAQKARDGLESVKRQVASRRGNGLLLIEPEGDPDPLLTRGDTEHGKALECLERGENGPADRHLDTVFSLAEQSATLIDRQTAAREQCTREIPARRAEAIRLQDAVAEAHGQRRELDSDFDPVSWQGVADNASRASGLLDSAEALLEQAATAAADSVQHYFRAVSLLEQVQAQQDQAQELAREVGERLRELIELRRDCSRRRDEVHDLARQTDAYLDSHERVVRSSARSRFDTAERNRRQIQESMDEARPHWSTIRDQLDATREGYAAARKEAEEDVRSHQQLTVTLDEAEREADRVGLFMRQHHEDRPQANQAYRSAADSLERVRQDSAGRGADWDQLVRRVEEAISGLRKAEELARADIQLADRAENALTEAGEELDRARRYSENGITADVGRATDLLEQARRHLGAREYERAIEQANAARQAATQSHDAAVRLVEQEQQREEEDRLRREAALSAPQPLKSSGTAEEGETGSAAWSSSGEPPESPSPSDPSPGEIPSPPDSGGSESTNW